MCVFLNRYAIFLSLFLALAPCFEAQAQGDSSGPGMCQIELCCSFVFTAECTRPRRWFGEVRKVIASAGELCGTPEEILAAMPGEALRLAMREAGDHHGWSCTLGATNLGECTPYTKCDQECNPHCTVGNPYGFPFF